MVTMRGNMYVYVGTNDSLLVHSFEDLYACIFEKNLSIKKQ